MIICFYYLFFDRFLTVDRPVVFYLPKIYYIKR